MSKNTHFSKKRKFDGRWYYLSPQTHHFVSKKEAENLADYFRSGGSSARVIKVKWGYVVYRRESDRKAKKLGIHSHKKITSDFLKGVKKRWYCGKCKRWHYNKSKIGKQHAKLDYKIVE